jgi:hypothetical protein
MLVGFGRGVLIEMVAEVNSMFGGRPLKFDQWEREVER